ncbi:MAG: hypothetical protein EOP38_31325, partial [Rubrivivax sp.]
MSNLLRWRDDHKMLPILLVVSVVLLLAIVAGALWSARNGGAPMRFASLRLQGAYERVEIGRTSQPQLAEMGFDAHRLRARTMSGLGVQEYFMPRTSREFDRLDPAIRACFDSPDRCTALVFPLQGPNLETDSIIAAHAAMMLSVSRLGPCNGKTRA